MRRGAAFEPRPRDALKDGVRRGELRLLLGTDAASEGLNLQRLGALINLDLPWNPSRLEQRKGRIQRIGQVRSEVDVYNMRYANSVEDRVRRLLSERLENVSRLFGQLPDTLEDVWVRVALARSSRRSRPSTPCRTSIRSPSGTTGRSGPWTGSPAPASSPTTPGAGASPADGRSGRNVDPRKAPAHLRAGGRRPAGERVGERAALRARPRARLRAAARSTPRGRCAVRNLLIQGVESGVEIFSTPRERRCSRAWGRFEGLLGGFHPRRRCAGTSLGTGVLGTRASRPHFCSRALHTPLCGRDARVPRMRRS